MPYHVTRMFLTVIGGRWCIADRTTRGTGHPINGKARHYPAGLSYSVFPRALSAGPFRLLIQPVPMLPKLFLGNYFLDSGSTSLAVG
jgi:hypothetical protein